MLQRAARSEAETRVDSQHVQVDCIRSFDALEARRDQWSGLLERSRGHTVFQSFEWHAAWWRIYGDDFELFVLYAERDGRLVGVAPLMVANRRLFGRQRRVLHFIGLYASDYCDFIVDEAELHALPAMLRWLAEHRQQWDMLDLRNVQEGSAALYVLPDFFGQSRDPVEVRHWNEAPRYRFGDPAADRDLQRKKSLRRHFNYFKREGDLQCRIHRTASEIESYLDAFFEQHIERWADTDTPSQFLKEQERSFYREMVRSLAPTGHLLFSVISFNQRPIAFHLGFEHGGCLIWYKPTYDVSLARHSPGEVLLKHLIDHAFERRLKELDFGPGEEGFKYRFANQTRSICSVHVFQDRLSWHYDRVRFVARTTIKRWPAVARVGRRVLDRWYGRLWY